MATLMKLKRSAVGGNVPTNSQLELGELALNTYDGKLYTKKSVGGTESIIEIGGGGSGEAIFTRYSFTATSGQTQFTAAQALDNINVFLNGLLLNETEDYTYSGATLTLVTGAQTNDEIEILDYNSARLIDGVSSTYLRNVFTATANQTSLSVDYHPGLLDLWLNGVKLISGTDYTATDGTTVTFASGLAANDVIETIAWNASSFSNLAEVDTLTFQDGGTLDWNTVNETLELDLDGTNSLLIGQEQQFYGKATESISAGDLVMFGGVQGDHLLISKADPSVNGFIVEWVMGVAKAGLAQNDFGYVTSFGKIDGLDTSSFTLGDLLYMDPTTAGGLTATEPDVPNHSILVAAVTKSHANEGTLVVRISHKPDIDELHGVTVTTVANGDILQYNSTNGHWENTNKISELEAAIEDAEVLALAGL